MKEETLPNRESVAEKQTDEKKYVVVCPCAENDEKIVCDVCGYVNPKYTTICKKCSNYL